MTGSDSNTQQENERKVEFSDPKSDARDSRLSIRKSNEEKYRKELLEVARYKCTDYSKAFRDCSIREGMFVVINCRKECSASKLNPVLFSLVSNPVVAYSE
jgi:hypothetical protein